MILKSGSLVTEASSTLRKEYEHCSISLEFYYQHLKLFQEFQICFSNFLPEQGSEKSYATNSEKTGEEKNKQTNNPVNGSVT